MNKPKIQLRLFALVMLCGLMLVFAGHLEAVQGKRKASKFKPKKVAIMLTDQEIKEALTEGAEIALVKVVKVEVEAPGTRGQRTRYHFRIDRNLTGQLNGTVDAARYGAAALQTGQHAVVALLKSSRFGLELLSFVIVPEDKKDDAVKAHLERIEKLKSTK